MKTISIAFYKAIVLSLCLTITSGAFAQAAESTLAPKALHQEDLPAQIKQEESRKSTDDTQAVSEDEGNKDPETENKIELSGNDEILVAIKVNGIIRDEGMSIFLPAGASYTDVMVPLHAISELLTFAIDVNTGDKKAEGFFISPDNVFQLDLNSGDVLVKGEKEKLEPGEAEIIEEDIFVRASSLQKWFGISASLNINSLVLNLDTGGDLPFQERLKRLMNAEKRMKTFRYEAVKPENAILAPYRNFSYPSLYITTTGGVQKSNSGQSFLGLATLQGNQDIAKFEADYAIGTRYSSVGTSEISNSRLTFQRRDNQNNLLGPLKAGRISFGDVSFPSVPLFAGGQRGAGVEISSDSRLGSRYATNSENFILDGDAPVGWDAELYRNGSFIAFQQVGSDGRFVFENVNLPSGFNNFEVILYGPQGQKTSIKREIARGPRLLKAGELQYDFAAGTPESDFLPFEKDAQNDRTPGMSGQLFYGVSKFFTLGTSVYSGPQDAISNDVGNFTNTSFESGSRFDNKDTVRASGAAVSAATSFSGINLQGQVLAADSGRRAYEVSAATRPLGFNLGVTHTIYRNFLSEDQDIKSRNEVNLSRNFGGLNLTFRVEDRDFLNRVDDRIFEQVTSFKFMGVSINNDLVRTVSKSESIDDFEGELSALASIYNIRLRSALLYDLDEDAPSRYRRLSFSGQKNISSNTSFRFEGSHDFESKEKNLNLRLSRDFEKYGLDFDVNADTENNYSFTVGLRMALQPDQRNNYHFVDPKTGGLASLGARAFIDSNNNDLYDAGEETIEGVEFKSSTRSDTVAADKEGVSYLTGLGEAPARIQVQSESIPDIYLAPKFDHRDLIPRRGSTPVIDFPFVKMSEIAGYLLHLKQGVEGVIVKLLNAADGSQVEQTETDYDGYFIFPAVKGGNYKIAFGLPSKDDFMSLNVVLDVTIDDPEEIKVEASDELAAAAKDAAAVRPSASNKSGAAQRNIDRMNMPAGELPNIDDPLNEEDLKPLDEKGIEQIITQ